MLLRISRNFFVTGDSEPDYVLVAHFFIIPIIHFISTISLRSKDTEIFHFPFSIFNFSLRTQQEPAATVQRVLFVFDISSAGHDVKDLGFEGVELGRDAEHGSGVGRIDSAVAVKVGSFGVNSVQSRKLCGVSQCVSRV